MDDEAEPRDETDLLRLAGRMQKRIAENPDHPATKVMRQQLALLDRILALGRDRDV